jgi:hypothetical protein
MEDGMNRKEHLLTCLAEECAEVSQRVSKALRFGMDEIQSGQGMTNADRIAEELHDLMSVWSICREEGLFLGQVSRAWSHWPDDETIDVKRSKIERYMEISIREGALIV